MLKTIEILPPPMQAPPLHWIRPDDPPEAFPDPLRALHAPDGLLAAGGDLSPPRLLAAYRRGIFPWYSEGQPILWWSPDPRTVLLPAGLHLSRSLRRKLRQRRFTVSFDRAFAEVMAGCAAPRRADSADGGTWITAAMQAAYVELHRLGHTHSLEVWMDGVLVGGLYGLALGRVFFGESMFSRATDASKIALACLARQLHYWDFALIDCQVHSAHLERLGAIRMPRSVFLRRIERFTALPGVRAPWRFDAPLEW